MTAATDGAALLDRAVDTVQRRREHWATIEQLLAGVTLIPWASAAEARDGALPEPRHDWAEVLVQAAAFAHIQVSPGCRGYTAWTAGRAGCGHCGWGMSARMADVGTAGSARFAQAGLARYGHAIALAVGKVVQTLFEAVLPC